MVGRSHQRLYHSAECRGRAEPSVLFEVDRQRVSRSSGRSGKGPTTSACARTFGKAKGVSCHSAYTHRPVTSRSPAFQVCYGDCVQSVSSAVRARDAIAHQGPMLVRRLYRAPGSSFKCGLTIARTPVPSTFSPQLLRRCLQCLKTVYRWRLSRVRPYPSTSTTVDCNQVVIVRRRLHAELLSSTCFFSCG